MSSSIFYRFKSQKEPQRVQFDGTSISVWEAKREIIQLARLGDGSDFDLLMYNADTNDEYDDDTVLIPRSSTVIVRRLPAAKPGQGRAARYISGRMPVNARSHRNDNTSTAQAAAPAVAPGKAIENMTEEERINAMFQAGSDQWEQQKQQMANAAPVFIKNNNKAKVNVPDHPPPSTYVCHRCGQPGHWIQACPTNDDPTMDNRRIRRTTGIPRSMLKTVEKPTAMVDDGLTDNTKHQNLMRDDKGNYVVAVPDHAAFEKFQAKTKAAASKTDEEANGNKELEERGLLCGIDKRLFVDPMKTPCCGRTYCSECIENALAETDLVCPGCSTDGVLIDNLVVDEDMNAKVKAWEEEKRTKQLAAEKAEREAAKVQSPGGSAASAKSPSASGSRPGSRDGAKSPAAGQDGKAAGKEDSAPPKTDVEATAASTASPVPGAPTGPAAETRKRKAEEELQNMHVPTGPKAMREQQQMATNLMTPAGFDPKFVEQMNKMAGGLPMPGMPGMGMMPGMPGMSGMSPMMMNPMMMAMMNGGMGMGMGNMNMNMGFPGANNMNGGFAANGQQNWAAPNAGGPGFQAGRGQQQQQGWKQFNQQSQLGDDGDAYMRKPVNPLRHQNKKKARPADFREL